MTSAVFTGALLLDSVLLISLPLFTSIRVLISQASVLMTATALLCIHASVVFPSPSPSLSFRGNSKYHYYGIRVKPDSPLNRLQEDMQYMALRQQPVQQKQRCAVETHIHTYTLGLSNLHSIFEYSSNSKKKKTFELIN